MNFEFGKELHFVDETIDEPLFTVRNVIGGAICALAVYGMFWVFEIVGIVLGVA